MRVHTLTFLVFLPLKLLDVILLEVKVKGRFRVEDKIVRGFERLRIQSTLASVQAFLNDRAQISMQERGR